MWFYTLSDTFGLDETAQITSDSTFMPANFHHRTRPSGLGPCQANYNCSNSDKDQGDPWIPLSIMKASHIGVVHRVM